MTVLLVPNEVALSPGGGDLAFDTESREFFEPLGFDGRRLPVSVLDLAKVQRLSTAVRWVNSNWPTARRGKTSRAQPRQK